MAKIKTCADCGVSIYRKSIRCRSCARKGSRNPFYGQKHTAEFRESISGERSHRWKGDKASYKAVHIWVTNNLGKPMICEFCGASRDAGAKMEWSCKDHKYWRNLSDYQSLCQPCHTAYDKKMGFLKYVPKKDIHTGKFIKSL